MKKNFLPGIKDIWGRTKVFFFLIWYIHVYVFISLEDYFFPVTSQVLTQYSFETKLWKPYKIRTKLSQCMLGGLQASMHYHTAGQNSNWRALIVIRSVLIKSRLAISLSDGQHCRLSGRDNWFSSELTEVFNFYFNLKKHTEKSSYSVSTRLHVNCCLVQFRSKISSLCSCSLVVSSLRHLRWRKFVHQCWKLLVKRRGNSIFKKNIPNASNFCQ